MRTVFCLGVLVAAALASSASWDSRPAIRRSGGGGAFRAGQHYTFDFDGQVSTGLPIPGSSQQSATRLQAVVSLGFQNDRVALLKIQKIRVGAAQRDLAEPRNLQPFGVFQETQLTQKQQEQLRLPLRFRYENGLVSDLEFDGEDQPWSENIKRAIVNMLQINLQKKARTDEAEISRLLRDSGNVDSNQNEFFTTQETILDGNCETAYTVVEHKSQQADEDEQLKVSKSVNYDKCAKRADIRYNYRFGEECPSELKKFYGEEQNTESATVINFKLYGNQREFVIREAELRSHYVFAPLDKKQQIMATYVAARLMLVEVSSEKNAIEEPKNVEKKQTLVYSTEWEEKLEKFRMTGDEQLLSDSPFSWMHKKVEIARHIVQQLAKEIEQDEQGADFQLEQNHQVARLVEVLRVATKEDVRKITHEFAKQAENGKEQQKLKNVCYDILAIAGTKPCIELLAEKIGERQISVVHAARIFKILVNVQTPSEQIVDLLVRLAKESSVERQPVLKQSIWLTIGALMNGVCSEKRDCMAREVSFERSHKICSRQTKQKFVEQIEQLYERTTSRYEKVLALKTMANAGFDLVVFPLEKIINDHRVEKTVRVEAINALRQLRFTMPRKIQALLMPIFKNYRESPEVRINAFHQIMQTLPERQVIDQIAQQLEKEPSHQVNVFVYSALKQFAKSTLPCEEAMKNDIQQSLRLARIQPRKMFDSLFGRSTLYHEKSFTGASLNWAAIFGKDSVLPKELSASLEAVFGGQWNKHLAQVGIFQQNLDQILYQILDKLEQNQQEDILVRGKRSSLTQQPAEMLRQMMQKMGIKHRRQQEKDAHAMIYIRYRDLDYAVLPIDEESLPTSFWKAFEQGKLDISEIEMFLARGMRFNTYGAAFISESTRIIATTLGLPVEITSKIPTVFSIDGEIKAELEPRSSSNVYGGRVLVNAKPKIASTHVWHMELRSPIVSQGIKLLHLAQLNIPINMVTEMKWGKNFDMKTIIKTPQQEQKQRIVLLHSRPVTYIRHENEQNKFAQEKTVFVPEQPRQPLNKVYGEDLLGVRMQISGNVNRHLLRGELQPSSVSPILASENHFEVVMHKGQDQPREYVIRMIVAAFDEESKMEKPEFEGFFQKDNENVFETEDYENDEENNMENMPLRRSQQVRKSSFMKYTNEYEASQTGYKHRIFVKAEAVGASRERKAELEIRSKCDDQLTFCKWNLDMNRSPVGSENSNWMLRLSAQTLFPEPVDTLKQLQQQAHRELQCTIDGEWGAGEKNQINMKVQVEQSREQQQWLHTLARMGQQEKLEYGEQYELVSLAGRLNQFKVVADYKLSEKTLVQMGRIHSLLHTLQPYFADVQLLKNNDYNKNGRLVAKMTVEPQSWRYANISVETPAEILRLSDLYLPIRPTFLSIEKSMPLSSLTQLGRKVSLGGFNTKQSTCQVASSKINTFDDVIYSVPLTTCYSVLAKDCADSQPKFAVLMKKIQKNGSEKKLKIITEENTIEVENMSGELHVKVDGEQIKSQNSLRKYNIEKRGENAIIFDNEDVFVRFDGVQADIRVNEIYKKHQCGLCGNYDGEYEGEFRSANGEETDDLEKFHRSFLTKGDECDMEESELSNKKNYKKFGQTSYSREEEENNIWEDSDEENDYDNTVGNQKFSLNTLKNNKNWKKSVFGSRKSFGNRMNLNNEEDYSRDNEEVIEPEEKTKVLEYSNRICFSKQPVPVCPRKSHDSNETKEMKIKFACINRSEPEARRLLRETKDSDVVEVSQLPESFVETYSVPKTCVVY